LSTLYYIKKTWIVIYIYIYITWPHIWNTLTALEKNYKFILYCMTQGVQNYNTLFTRYLRIRKMPKPYSDDLRWRLVWLKLFYGMSNVDISSTLFVSPKTVSRIYRLFVTTGNVTSPKVFWRPKGTTKLYEHEELIICEI
jgi:hypothetical protein